MKSVARLSIPEQQILSQMSDISQLLTAIDRGDSLAADQLLPLVYAELRTLAASKMIQESPGQTLQATALVHEAFVRLVDVQNAQKWNSRGHFFAAAAEAMRRILVENARRRQQLKRGGEFQRVVADDIAIVADSVPEDLIALDEALSRLATTDPEAARLIQLRYFTGLTIPEAARSLGISPRSADRLWAFARAWLHREISGTSMPTENL
jgi:RNA polymerase sigma factor (TIGR02999 family)